MVDWLLENLLALVMSAFAGLGILLTVYRKLNKMADSQVVLSDGQKTHQQLFEAHKKSFDSFKTQVLVINERQNLLIDEVNRNQIRHEDKCEREKTIIFDRLDRKADKVSK